MGKDLVLVSHGSFCEGLKASAEMIMGPQDHIHTVAFLPEEGLDTFRDKFEKVTKHLTNMVVLADLLGGTPANVVSRMILEGATFDLYTGMNLPMVMGFLNAELLDQDLEMINYGTTGVQHVNQLLQEADDESDDED